MPSLGADMEAGTLVEWRVREGDRVQRGDIIAVAETQKGAIEVEIWEAGVMDRILVQPGAEVPVGTVLATLRAEDGAPAPASAVPIETAPAPAAASPAPTPLPSATVPAEAPAAPMAEPPRRQVSPAARQLARELGVDLAQVTGTGPHGSVTRTDVERASQPAPPSPRTPDGAQREAMQRAIAAAMGRSKRDIPHFYLATTICMQRCLDWLESQNRERPVERRLLPLAPLLRAVALALRGAPELNGFYEGDAFRPGPGIHLGVAIALRQGGLVAPALHDADKKGVDEIMRDLAALLGRARAGALRSSELSDPTVTVTSLGEQGVETVFGVIYPPQVALVGLGRIVERPWAEGGMVGSRPVMRATLAADHRVSDGHRGGRFLVALDRLLQEPEKL
jgi:pyruvate dehydrogenase E2 component (dihydrolipoamide acetyltransferase)